jgi:hypothetical protein
MYTMQLDPEQTTQHPIIIIIIIIIIDDDEPAPLPLDI